MLGGEQKARHGLFWLDLLWPKYCYNCQQPGSWLCHDCQRQLTANWRWRSLLIDHKSSLAAIIYCADYHQPLLNKLLKLTKYQRLTMAGRILAINLAEFIQQTIAGQPWFQQSFITAVPLSRQRLNWRGFNQSQLLAETIAEVNCCPIANYWHRQHRPPQTHLNRNTRLANLNQAFSWLKYAAGQDFIIIDDVVTTGATLTEMANCLKQSGANEVRGLVLAH